MRKRDDKGMTDLLGGEKRAISREGRGKNKGKGKVITELRSQVVPSSRGSIGCNVTHDESHADPLHSPAISPNFQGKE